MLDAHGIGAHPVDDVETVHASIEAMKLAFADLHQYNADIDAMPVKPDALLNPDYLRSRAALIAPFRAECSRRRRAGEINMLARIDLARGSIRRMNVESIIASQGHAGKPYPERLARPRLGDAEKRGPM
eukprot:gene54852-75151_t